MNYEQKLFAKQSFKSCQYKCLAAESDVDKFKIHIFEDIFCKPGDQISYLKMYITAKL